MTSLPPFAGRDPGAPRGDDAPGQHCPVCGHVLDRCQPDDDDPTRLIGMCEGCGEWYLLVLDPQTDLYELRGAIRPAGTAAGAA